MLKDENGHCILPPPIHCIEKNRLRALHVFFFNRELPDVFSVISEKRKYVSLLGRCRENLKLSRCELLRTRNNTTGMKDVISLFFFVIGK